jgi:putative membrane protein
LSQLDPNRNHRLWSVFLRGMGMGAADIVPGVSGGTIAFITGIYFRLLEAISGLPEAAWNHLRKGRFREFWRACDGTFLLCLLSGVLVSIATLATVISYALDEYPILIWSFFFGLIVASVWHVSRQVKSPGPGLLLPFVVGVVFAWWVGGLSGMPLQPSLPMFFGAGMLAICAMILPGISGSFILVILGMYAPVLDAIRAPEPAILAVFAIGCLLGLLSVARVITWAFSRFHDLVLALLIGFMVGALNKVWPWKETLTWRTNSSGEEVPLNEASVSPFSYAEQAGQDPQILLALLFSILGLGLVLGIEWAGKRQ